MENSPVNPESLLAWKWKKAKEYYERAYNVNFTKMPEPEQVDFLYKQIFKLSSDMASHLNRRSDLQKTT